MANTIQSITIPRVETVYLNHIHMSYIVYIYAIATKHACPSLRTICISSNMLHQIPIYRDRKSRMPSISSIPSICILVQDDRNHIFLHHHVDEIFCMVGSMPLSEIEIVGQPFMCIVQIYCYCYKC